MQKNPYKTKFQLLINKGKRVGLKHCDDSKVFIEHSNKMDDICENLDECNPNKKLKILIVFDDMIAYMHNNEKLYSIVIKLFICVRKPSICLVFITQSYFAVPENPTLSSTHHFIIKMPKIKRASPNLHQPFIRY